MPKTVKPTLQHQPNSPESEPLLLEANLQNRTEEYPLCEGEPRSHEDGFVAEVSDTSIVVEGADGVIRKYFPVQGSTLTMLPLVFPKQQVYKNQPLAINTTGLVVENTQLDNVVLKQTPALSLPELDVGRAAESQTFSGEAHVAVPLMHFRSESQQATSKILICIHGIGGSNQTFKRLGTEFARVGYDVHAITLPEFGQLHSGGNGVWPGADKLLN